MDVLIKKDVNLDRLKKFGFTDYGKYYIRPVKQKVLLTVDKETRILNIRTPLGIAAFPDSLKENYQDLIEAGVIEYSTDSTTQFTMLC